MQIVYFHKGRNGDPITRYEGKIAFPDRRSKVELGEPYLIQEAHPNPKGTVFFLRVEPLDLEAIARRGQGQERLDYAPPRGKAAEVETNKGLCRAYIQDDQVVTELYPWGKAYQTVALNPPVEVVPGVEASYIKVALAPAGQEPQWALAVPSVKDPDRLVVLEEKIDPRGMQKYQERLATSLRLSDEQFEVGSVRLALPEVQGQEVAGVRLTGWANPNYLRPTPCDSVWVSLERTVEANPQDWQVLSHRVQRYKEQEENTWHYGSETWGTGSYSWVDRARHHYVLENRHTGEILTRTFSEPLKEIPLAPPSEQERLTPELWASGLRRQPVNYLLMEEKPVLSVDTPVGRVELSPKVENGQLLAPRSGYEPYWEVAGEGAMVSWYNRVETSVGEGTAKLSGKLTFREGRLEIAEPSLSRLELDSPPPTEQVARLRPAQPNPVRPKDEVVTVHAVLAPQNLEVRALDPVGQEFSFQQAITERNRPDPDGLFSVRVFWQEVHKSNLEEFELSHTVGGKAVLCHKESGEALEISVDKLPRDFLARSSGGQELER
jgi:hypothetical protein